MRNSNIKRQNPNGRRINNPSLLKILRENILLKWLTMHKKNYRMNTNDVFKISSIMHPTHPGSFIVKWHIDTGCYWWDLDEKHSCIDAIQGTRRGRDDL